MHVHDSSVSRFSKAGGGGGGGGEHKLMRSEGTPMKFLVVDMPFILSKRCARAL